MHYIQVHQKEMELTQRENRMSVTLRSHSSNSPTPRNSYNNIDINIGHMHSISSFPASLKFKQDSHDKETSQPRSKTKTTTEITTKTTTQTQRQVQLHTRIRPNLNGLTTRQLSKKQTLLHKLFILLATNVVVTLSMLAVLGGQLPYFAGSMDMIVSNACLWLTYNFNDNNYQQCCKLCIFCHSKISRVQ